MAPSNVFSYFRSHKRNSNPPSPDVASSSNGGPLNGNYHTDLPPYGLHDSASAHADSAVSPYPPTLPPIPRFAATTRQAAEHSIPPVSRDPVKEKARFSIGKSKQGKDVTADRYPMDAAPPNNFPRKPVPDSSVGYGSPKQAYAGSDTGGAASSRAPAHALHAPHLLAPSPSSLYPTASASASPISPAWTVDQSSLKSPGSETTHPPRSGKGKLNLLNPMALLLRRRSSQALEALDHDPIPERGPATPSMDLPNDYDPRIRGTKVHDFSAPRKRLAKTPAGHNQQSAYQRARTSKSNEQPSPADSSPSKADHTPIFKENFDDDLRPQELDRAVRAETLANQKFLQRASWQEPSPPERTPPAILFPVQDEPLNTIANRRAVSPPPDLRLDTNQEFPPLSPVAEGSSPAETLVNDSNFSITSSRRSLHTTRSRATSGSDPNFQPAGLPTHMTSKASRFSFQILGSGSADQEKLLEERHKQKAAAKAAAEGSNETPDFAEDDYDEDAMYEDMMNDYDGFEETIPGMEDDDIPGGEFSVVAERGQGSSPMLYNSATYSPMGNIQTMGTPNTFSEHTTNTTISGRMQNLSLEASELSLHQERNPLNGLQHETTGSLLPTGLPGSDARQDFPSEDGDDLYFDDGMIDDPESTDGDKFDESAFDDPSNPLYERPAPKRPLSDMLSMTADADLEEEIAMVAPKPSVRKSAGLDALGGPLIRTPSADLDNLNAYHDALAEVVNKAAADGRFVRHPSVDLTNAPSTFSPSASTVSSRPSLIPDEGRFSLPTTAPFSPTGLDTGFLATNDYGYDDFEGDLEDDPMIAEANAEALAYELGDEDYGQEFGFYPAASAGGESVFSNGGYFGPRDQMLGRSTSGRNAVREPNLTPITERSEYSTRNSFISIANQYPWHGVGQNPVTSPGLAQLARLSPYGFPEDDSDISLEKLRKLRRDAFGGSNGSLKSAGSSPRNSIPGDPATRHGSSGLVNGTNFIAWNLDNSSMQDSSELHLSSETDAYHTQRTGDHDQDTLDAVNARSGSGSDASEFDDDDSQRSYYGDDLDEDFEGESPTITSFRPEFHSTPHLTSATLAQSAQPASNPVRPQLSIVSATTNASYEAISRSPVMAGPVAQLPALISPLTPLTPFAINATWNQAQYVQAPLGNPSAVGHSIKGTNGHPGRRTHSRKTSGADSVTYVREQDEQGEERWVLERRRTADTGEMELIGRQIVEGGRI